MQHNWWLKSWSLLVGMQKRNRSSRLHTSLPASCRWAHWTGQLQSQACEWAEVWGNAWANLEVASLSVSNSTRSCLLLDSAAGGCRSQSHQLSSLIPDLPQLECTSWSLLPDERQTWSVLSQTYWLLYSSLIMLVSVMISLCQFMISPYFGLQDTQTSSHWPFTRYCRFGIEVAIDQYLSTSYHQVTHKFLSAFPRCVDDLWTQNRQAHNYAAHK